MQTVTMRTGVWYNDHPIQLTFPDSWDVVTHWPNTPPPLRDKEIVEKINSPINQHPLREIAKGRKNPVIITDDLARPTPVYKVLPFVLNEFKLAGIELKDIRILIATGTHGKQNEEALVNKIGAQTYNACRVIIHNDKKGTRYIGKTSFGTPVYINEQLLDSGLVIGISGVYPQHTTGFGGGSKLALGILGRKSIMNLHFRHKGVGGTYNIDNTFRKDVSEIAQMIGLRTMFSLHINGSLEIVNLMCGDHFIYYPQAAEFSKDRYTTPLPDDADVVIANSYPSDISYTFMQKSMKPILCAPKKAIKIVVASNSEGIGKHGLFQQGISQRMKDYRALYYKIRVMPMRVIMYKIYKNVFIRNQLSANSAQESQATNKASDQLWLYRPGHALAPMPYLSGVNIIQTWDEVLKVIKQEYSTDAPIKVRIYPCASLQCLDAQVNQSGGD